MGTNKLRCNVLRVVAVAVANKMVRVAWAVLAMH